MRAVLPALLALAGVPFAPARASAVEANRRFETPLELFHHNLARGGRYAPGAVLLEAREGVSDETIRVLSESRGCRIGHRLGRRPLYLLECEKRDPAVVFQAFAGAAPVRWMEAAWIEEELEAEPNDLIADQWHHRNTGQTIDGVPGVRGADVGSVAAWDASTGTDGFVVAVVDTGIYPDHVDLIGRLWRNPDEVCGNRVDDDQNGYVDDCDGWDVGESDNNPHPGTLPADSCNEGHATFMAGLIGAGGNNGIGLTGMLWNAKLMSIKRVHDQCGATSAMSIEGTAYGVDNGAQVISIAFNGTSYSQIYANVLAEAAEKGIIVVMSAGNDGESNDVVDRYPNNYVFATKLVVANTTNQDLLSAASNYGARNVDIAAPGADVYSLGMDGNADYDRASGTSFSQAIAAGGVGVVWSAHPSLSATDIVASIREGAKRLPALDCARTTRCISTGGRLDLPAALAKAAERDGAYRLVVEQVVVHDEGEGDGDGTLEEGEYAALDVVLRNDGTTAVSGVVLSLELTEPGAVLSPIDTTALLPDLDVGWTGSTADAGDSFTVEIDPACDRDHVVALQLTARDSAGRTQRLPLAVNVLCSTGGSPPPADAGPSVVPDAGVGVDAGDEGDPRVPGESSGCSSTETRSPRRGRPAIEALGTIGALLLLTFRRRRSPDRAQPSPS